MRAHHLCYRSLAEVVGYRNSTQAAYEDGKKGNELACMPLITGTHNISALGRKLNLTNWILHATATTDSIARQRGHF
jgi:hypothetical protein